MESGDVEAQDKFQKRTVRVTKEHNEDIKTLLRLMGCPVIEAPCEAEAQCAALAKQGHVFASASEDMDTLTFGTPKLLRKFTAPESKKIPVMEINLERALEGLKLTMDEFIDLCILCGCDYMDSIKGVGSKTAYKLIKEHGSLEKVLEKIRKDGKGHTIPEVFPIEAARELFKNHPVIPSKEVSIKFTKCNEAELTKFLVETKGFNPERIARQIERLKKVTGQKQQRRMDSFFTVMPGKKRVLPNKVKTKGKNSKKKARR